MLGDNKSDDIGCNAGNKMVYIDAFGEVSPCVFTPLSFGNVRTGSLASIVSEMKQRFPPSDTCFINKYYRLLQRYSTGRKTLSKADTLKMLEEVRFGGLSKFNKLYYKPGAKQKTVTADVKTVKAVNRYESL